MQPNTKAICTRCNGRMARLFLRNGRFACRTCKRLRYLSQALDPMGCNQKKLTRRYSKPKGIHWRTHERMETIDNKIDGAFINRAAEFFKRMGLKL
jgi:hypothetical protein